MLICTNADKNNTKHTRTIWRFRWCPMLLNFPLFFFFFCFTFFALEYGRSRVWDYKTVIYINMLHSIHSVWIATAPNRLVDWENFEIMYLNLVKTDKCESKFGGKIWKMWKSRNFYRKPASWKFPIVPRWCIVNVKLKFWHSIRHSIWFVSMRIEYTYNFDK